MELSRIVQQYTAPSCLGSNQKAGQEQRTGILRCVQCCTLGLGVCMVLVYIQSLQLIFSHGWLIIHQRSSLILYIQPQSTNRFLCSGVHYARSENNVMIHENIAKELIYLNVMQMICV